jgi:hypothetical protein
VVLGVRIVPAHAPSTTITRNSDLQDACQTDHVRHRALHVAVQPSLTRHPCRRHHLRSPPRPHPTLRARDVLHVLRRHRRLHDRRRDVPPLNARGPRAPAAARHALAALSARPWMATSITDFWSFRWHQFFRNTFVAFGARPGGALFGKAGRAIRRIRRVRFDTLRWFVGAREGDGVQQRKFLPSDGRRRGARARLVARDWLAGAGFLGLGVDDDVDPFLGHVYAGWMGTTRHDRMRLFQAWATTRESDRRCYHFSHDEPLTNLSNWISDHHRGQTQHT